MKHALAIACLIALLPTQYSQTEQPVTMNPVEAQFRRIYHTNQWQSKESASGPGSELRFTQRARNGLETVIKLLEITSMVDAACGDLNWMQHVNLGTCLYLGVDIVPEIIRSNIQKFGPEKQFKHINLVETIIGKVDLILCRDMLAHLTNEQVITVLRNFKKSGSKFILMTTGVTTKENVDIHMGDWRPINFELPPFNLPKPLLIIQEDVPFKFEQGKHLGLWFLKDIDL